MVRKSSYKEVLAIIGSIFILIITVVLLRVTGYWGSKFYLKEKEENIVNITFINPDPDTLIVNYQLKNLFFKLVNNLGLSGITCYQMTEGGGICWKY